MFRYVSDSFKDGSPRLHILLAFLSLILFAIGITNVALDRSATLAREERARTVKIKQLSEDVTEIRRFQDNLSAPAIRQILGPKKFDRIKARLEKK